MDEEKSVGASTYSRAQSQTFIEGIEAREKKWEKRYKKDVKIQRVKAKNLKKHLKAFRKAR